MGQGPHSEGCDLGDTDQATGPQNEHLAQQTQAHPALLFCTKARRSRSNHFSRTRAHAVSTLTGATTQNIEQPCSVTHGDLRTETRRRQAAQESHHPSETR